MKILYITPYSPTRIRTRPYNLIRTLTKRGHEVTLASIFESAQDAAQLDGWEESGVRVIRAPLTKYRAITNSVLSWFTRAPMQARYCWQPYLAEALRTELSKTCSYDVVHVEHLRGAPFAIDLQSHFRKVGVHKPIVWDSVDCISLLFAQALEKSNSWFGQFVTRADLPRTRRYEGELVTLFEKTLVTSGADRMALYSLVREPLKVNPSIVVLPNGVDLEYFKPRNERRDPYAIVFSGKMSYHANVTAASFLLTEVMPRVWAQVPRATVHVVGQNPPAYMNRFVASNPSQINVTGSVADIRPYLSKATVAVAPMVYSAGIQNKVLEAMALATPVVATEHAVSELLVRPGQDLLIGTNADSVSQAIILLLNNAVLQNEIGHNGRSYVERNHDWNVITSQLEGVYSSVTRHSAAAI